jgi:hypothetical protein
MLRRAVFASFAVLALSALPAAAQQGRVQAGVLECRGGPNVGFVVGSVAELRCLFRSDWGPQQVYLAKLTKIGVDLGFKAQQALVWGVFAPTQQIGYGDLTGSYAGVTGGAAVGAGVGANVMYGGSNNTISLQPLSVEGQVGLNVFGGIGALELRPGQ